MSEPFQKADRFALLLVFRSLIRRPQIHTTHTCLDAFDGLRFPEEKS
jgi:hypothetical protein